MTRWPSALGLAALLLSGCGQPEPPPAAGYGQVIWKEGTPVGRRSVDLRACELQAIGLTDPASQEEIETAAAATPAPEHDRLLRACLVSRGYQIVEFPVCTEADMPPGSARRILATETLPPVDQVRCVTADRGGFVPL